MHPIYDYIDANFTYRMVSGGKEMQVMECPICGHSGEDNRTYVNVKTGMGFCHHHGKGFKPEQFVMDAEGISWGQAKKRLYGKESGYVRSADPVKEETTPSELEFPPLIPVYDEKMAFDYLHKRGVTDEMIEKFNISYCNKNAYLGGKFRFTAGRVIIPIYGIRGTLDGWQGRDVTGTAALRYLFNEDFKGKEHLYNVHNIKPYTDYIVISEGVFDALGWYSAGVTQVVATFGKKISDEQVTMLLRKKPKVVFMAWDDDALKEKFAFAEKHGHYFKEVRIVNMMGKDADEMTKKELATALTSASPYSWSMKVKMLI